MPGSGALASNLEVVIIREHLSARGIGLQGNLHDESSVVPSIPMVHLMHKFGTPEQKAKYLEGLVTGEEGLKVAQNFVHQNRIRQAAQSCGVARYCIQKSVKRARAWPCG